MNNGIRKLYDSMPNLKKFKIAKDNKSAQNLSIEKKVTIKTENFKDKNKLDWNEIQTKLNSGNIVELDPENGTKSCSLVDLSDLNNINKIDQNKIESLSTVVKVVLYLPFQKEQINEYKKNNKDYLFLTFSWDKFLGENNNAGNNNQTINLNNNGNILRNNFLQNNSLLNIIPNDNNSKIISSNTADLIESSKKEKKIDGNDKKKKNSQSFFFFGLNKKEKK